MGCPHVHPSIISWAEIPPLTMCVDGKLLACPPSWQICLHHLHGPLLAFITLIKTENAWWPLFVPPSLSESPVWGLVFPPSLPLEGISLPTFRFVMPSNLLQEAFPFFCFTCDSFCKAVSDISVWKARLPVFNPGGTTDKLKLSFHCSTSLGLSSRLWKAEVMVPTWRCYCKVSVRWPI